MSARQSPGAIGVAGLTTILLVAFGCAARPKPRASHPLQLTDFVAEAPSPPTAPSESAPFVLGAGDAAVLDALLVEDESAIQPMAVGVPVVVESMIGQVNGRPIFADQFFEPIEDELIALSREVDRREYVDLASEIVSTQLRQVILNALFLAEAEAGLSAQESLGVRAWLGSIREGLISGFGGSETQAQQDLRESGETLDSRLADIKDRALIRKVIDERINPRVIVSWRDVEREYERQYDVFNPPATVTLGRIRLVTLTNAEVIADVTRRFAAGETFAQVAELVGSDVWQTFESDGTNLVPPSISEGTVRDHLAELHNVGDVTAPFVIGPTTWWVSVVKLDRPPGRSLYDEGVQRQIRDYLRTVRSNEEQNRFIATLLEKGIYDELEAMAERLLTIAILRYAPVS